jgi:hypothetical protein
MVVVAVAVTVLVAVASVVGVVAMAEAVVGGVDDTIVLGVGYVRSHLEPPWPSME